MTTYSRRGGAVMALVAVAMVVGACATPGIVHISDDTYRVSRADPGHVFADDAAMKAAAVADAEAFARGRGMVAEPVAFQSDTLAVGHLKTVDYDFRLVPAQPATAAATAPSPAVPAVVVPPAAPAQSAAVPPPPATAPRPAAARPDYYDELIRLDDLRKRGILTDAEFQSLKAKLIATR